MHTGLRADREVAYVAGPHGSLAQLLLDSGNLSLETAKGRDSLLGHWQIPISTELSEITKETSKGARSL